jgi:branched-chain amino acid transport system ATP-binding protein
MLELSSVYTYYASREALNGLSLYVDYGEITALVGSNGSGKSTVLHTISGLTPAASGSVTYAGMDITRLPPHEIARRGVAFVQNGRRVFSKMSVLENLKMGAFCRKDPRAVRRDMAYVLERFQRVAERQHQLAGTLSGGEQQLLAIARALMARPQLLLLDEPSMGLSPLLLRDVYTVVQMLNREGVTILLVEQNAQLALSLAKRAYVIQAGAVVQAGQTARLRDNPSLIEALL